MSIEAVFGTDTFRSVGRMNGGKLEACDYLQVKNEDTGESLKISLADLPKDMLPVLAFHGLKQKLSDSTAIRTEDLERLGKTRETFAWEQIAAMLEQLADGLFTVTRESGDAQRLVDLFDSLLEVAKATDQLKAFLSKNLPVNESVAEDTEGQEAQLKDWLRDLYAKAYPGGGKKFDETARAQWKKIEKHGPVAEGIAKAKAAREAAKAQKAASQSTTAGLADL